MLMSRPNAGIYFRNRLRQAKTGALFLISVQFSADALPAPIIMKRDRTGGLKFSVEFADVLHG